ncbi:UDP-2,3-diacylglucosamine diphosphatase [Pelagibacterium xiamenense]|uniref:UDP-2,3-diacylglucosamine diphosphatase n=1 Tax=Pelagibacterium xiamenense TaxID=2901140 RepID=UPI001E3E6FCE|nr:UDP-2,3-diacylglucosamine diphosphatase [Pelagibacterium xiamenense]MCD7060056.1 UDP-2,3-diacylglucosamine diphosphatase [Pelagibacterium xiamenense]
MEEPQSVRHVRALFISDVHLGMKNIRVAELVQFLPLYEADTIYIVGDLIDGWRLQKEWHWPPLYDELASLLLDKAARGTRMVYLAGNHDEFLRDYLGTYFGGVEIVDRAIHETAAGRRYLVIHGDQFDVVVANAKWLAHIGDWAYNLALRVNVLVNWVRRRLGLAYWSLSAWAKQKVKNAVSIMGRFEEALSLEARNSEVDGVICGHIHNAAMHHKFGIHYLNSGDWVESCTAIVETHEGEFELIRWGEISAPPKKRRRFGRRRDAAQNPEN